MQSVLSLGNWLGLSKVLRDKFRAEFRIPQDVSIEVVDGHVICDGTSQEALLQLTIEKLQAFTHSKSNEITTLVLAAVDKFEAEDKVINAPESTPESFTNANPKEDAKIKKESGKSLRKGSKK